MTPSTAPVSKNIIQGVTPREPRPSIFDVKTYAYEKKRASRVDETSEGVTKYRACQQKNKYEVQNNTENEPSWVAIHGQLENQAEVAIC